MSTGARSYLHADAPFGSEIARLRLLQARYDGETARRLRMAGPLEGACCLEVGGGAGSIAALLAEAVGPTGQVVVLDRDPRFLVDLAARHANLSVSRHDITVDRLEASAFDLVHCRALLLHLVAPEQALRTMAAALRPGGWLVVEDADYSTLRAADPDHPCARRFDAAVRAMVDGFLARSGTDLRFGQRLPALVDGLGLADRGGEALEFRRRGGTPEAEFLIRSVERSWAEVVRAGAVTPADLDVVLRALADPSFEFVDSLNIAAWGRRRAPEFLG